MKITVVGAGAIGCYVGGLLLAQAIPDLEVVFVGRESLMKETEENGGWDITTEKNVKCKVPAERISITTKYDDALAGTDAVFLCVKSAGTVETCRDMQPFLPPTAVVMSFQNGVRNGELIRSVLTTHPVVGGMVGFGVVWSTPAHFHRGTMGDLLFELPVDATALKTVKEICTHIRRSGIVSAADPDFAAAQYGKFIINLQNSINAISGLSTKAMFLHPKWRRIISWCLYEAVQVLERKGIPFSNLYGNPRLMSYAMFLPTWIFKLAAPQVNRLDDSTISSMHQDIKKGRTTEIDFLNGEVVRLAGECGAAAPVNQVIVDIIKKYEEDTSAPFGPFNPMEVAKRMGLSI